MLELLINTYPQTTVNFEDLEDILISYEPFILRVLKEGVKFEFLVRIKESSKKLLVFGSGAYNPEKMKPPVFQRHTWINKFEESMILYNDPTLYLGPLSLGWGHGTTNRFYLEEIAEILQIIMKRILVNANQVIFYGSSGGGFMSMVLAGFIQGSTALVNNPQTIVTNYYQSHVNKLFQHSHPELTIEEINRKYNHRLNAISLFKKFNYVPKITYIQNVACEHDMTNHVLPFIEGLKEFNKITHFHNVQFEFYYDDEKGHNPLELEETLYYINKLIKNM
ncbi:glycosyl transferase family 2 [Fictibacillus nanhaiensis]|uniref:Glycosyl transferase family 2 n=1 Tax=Fictibacillus nanhaiensis TaxID=742169 RepID=A0ABS2ZM86_9BACL|nr:glycosyl transferase family 2 [Fictibacillus nanhaiensis]